MLDALNSSGTPWPLTATLKLASLFVIQSQILKLEALYL
jgi:hypothetical protein